MNMDWSLLTLLVMVSLMIMMMFFPIRVVIPLCGGNIDTTVLGRCLERGLAADGRLVKFTVTVSDRPGGQCQPSFIYVYEFYLIV